MKELAQSLSAPLASVLEGIVDNPLGITGLAMALVLFVLLVHAYVETRPGAAGRKDIAEDAATTPAQDAIEVASEESAKAPDLLSGAQWSAWDDRAQENDPVKEQQQRQIQRWREMLARAVRASRYGDGILWSLASEEEWYALRSRMKPAERDRLTPIPLSIEATLPSLEGDDVPLEARIIERAIARIEKEWRLV
jgi:hypothetical protein